MKRLVAISAAIALSVSTAFAGSTVETAEQEQLLQDPTLMSQTFIGEQWIIPLLALGMIALAISNPNSEPECKTEARLC